MRCLYCGKELALLKRLTRGGEFCSEAHKNSYQEEYNRLGLSRLLQAQSKTAGSKPPPTTPPAPPGPALATQEPATQEVTARKVAAPPPAVVPPTPVAAVEAQPPAILGFAMEKPSHSSPPEPLPYVEPWLTSTAETPTLPVWPFDDQSLEHPVFAFPLGDLLPLAMHPGAGENQHPVAETNATPRDFVHPKVNMNVSVKVSSSRIFPAGRSVAMEVAPRPSENAGYASVSGALDFPIEVDVHAWELLELTPAGIAYPAEDSEVMVPEPWTNGVITGAAVDITVPAIPRELPDQEPHIDAPPPGTENGTPRAALEALSKLHQNMKESGEAVAPGEIPTAEPVPSEAAPQPVEPAEPAPREAVEMLAISLKSFAPPKPAPAVESRAQLGTAFPVLPRLKAIPLRAKVAPAPRGFGQESKPAPAGVATPEAKSKAASANIAPPPAEPKSKPAGPVKPQPRAAQTAQPTEAPKPKETQKAQTDTAKPVRAADGPGTKQPTVAPPAKSEPGKASPADTAQVEPLERAKTPESGQTGTGATNPPAAQKPAEKAPADKKEPDRKREAAPSTVRSEPDSTIESIPNFGAVVNTSTFGSFKVKLGIAAVVAVICAAAYFGLAGKSTRVPATVSASADGVGPSIMVGEGGWVEGWGGDPIGLHAGRQITMYRPSLKLSDYRFEFLGQIESKSMGWVFRASDPENYYAMKLVLVSPELPLTVTLYKYIVLKGRQIQVGRVPIEVAVKNDTVFKTRVDVRGPKFTTYVQGQPVDVWTDDQLRSGGVGFLNERMERSRIKSVSLSYLTGGIK